MKIVVLSKSYEASLGIGWSLSEAGFDDIDLLFIGKGMRADIAVASNVYKQKQTVPTREDGLIVEKLVEEYADISKDCASELVLFPADDYTTSLVDRYREQLEPIFLYTYCDGHRSGDVTRLMDKALQAKLAPRFDLPMARYWVTECEGGSFSVPDDVVFPCFVKPLISANGAAKSNMAKCDNRAALNAHLQRVVKKGATEPMIIQEFIDIEEEFNIHGVCDGDRLILPVIHKKLITGVYTKGVTVMGKNLDPEVLEPHISQLKEMLLSLGYHGIFNVEMFRSGSRYYLNEINVRIAGTTWGSAGAGANISALWVNALMGKYVDRWPEIDVCFDSVFINDKTAYEDVNQGNYSRAQLEEWNRSAEYHLIKSDIDPEPWKVFLKGMEQNGLKRAIKRFVKKIVRK